MTAASSALRGFLAPALVALACFACSEPATGLAEGTRMEVALTSLRPLDPLTEGTYELWVVRSSGEPISVGRFELPEAPAGSEFVVPFEMPIANPSRVMVTVEPPGDQDAKPSMQELLAGPVPGRLTIDGSVTNGLPLERDPGHHSLFTTSNNVEMGYPSNENAGLWLFSITVTVNKHGTREVKLAPLNRGWLYAGWVVYRQGTPDEVWVPYGKFRPGDLGLLTSRDNTGSGYFSGDQDFVNGGVEDVPGDEWTTARVAEQLGLTMPGDLNLPVALDALDPITHQAVWHHVITIEPSFDESEPPLTDRPFFLRPYRNPIGAGHAGIPRKIVYQGGDPAGAVRAAR